MILWVPKQYPTIQDAVNAAQQGDTIRVSPGVYREEVSVATEGLLIEGCGCNTVLYPPDGTGNGVGFSIFADHVEIRKFTITGFEEGIASFLNAGGILADLCLNGNSSDGIFLDSCNNYLVASVFSTRNGDDGLEISSCIDTTVVASQFVHNSYGVYNPDSTGTRIIHSELRGNTNEGFLNTASLNTQFLANTAVNNGDGVFDSVALGGLYVDSKITDNVRDGIQSTLSALNTFAENRISRNGGSGIFIDSEASDIIERNQINRNNNGGIFLQSAARITVRFNELSRNKPADIIAENSPASNIYANCYTEGSIPPGLCC